jgi:hypothetical protein
MRNLSLNFNFLRLPLTLLLCAHAHNHVVHDVGVIDDGLSGNHVIVSVTGQLKHLAHVRGLCCGHLGLIELQRHAQDTCIIGRRQNGPDALDSKTNCCVTLWTRGGQVGKAWRIGHTS